MRENCERESEPGAHTHTESQLADIKLYKIKEIVSILGDFIIIAHIREFNFILLLFSSIPCFAADRCETIFSLLLFLSLFLAGEFANVKTPIEFTRECTAKK